MRNTKSLNPVGYLEISKLFEDGREEVVFQENNVITSGMGVGFSHLFSASGSPTITDYQILNFLIGSAGSYSDYGTSTYELQAPLINANDWGSDTSLIIEDMYPIQGGSILGATRPLARIRFSNIQKVTNTSVRFTLVLDRGTLNRKAINEIGLYMRNPRGVSPPSPILVAYRPFTDIVKTSDFSLIFRWTIQF